MRRRIRNVAILFLSVIVCGDTTAAAPDLILHNGNVITVDDQFSVVDAVAVSGERISAVGRDAEVLALAGPTTRIVDLNRQTVIPGLIDSHVHPLGAATYEFDHRVPDVETMADVLSYIASRADAVEDGQWIRVQQMFITRLKEQRFPTRAELDQAAPRNPVIYRTGPDLAVNSLALARSGIDENYRLPRDSTGRIGRDENGRLNGIIRGASTIIDFKPSQRTPTDAERANLLESLLRDYNSVGITSASDRNSTDDAIEGFHRLRKQGRLTCRMYLYYGIDTQREPQQIRDRIESLANHSLHQYDNRLWLNGVKVFLDGGMLTGSALMREPWGVSQIYSITDPAYRGTLKIPPERLYQIAAMATANGLQITAHAVGDGAVENLIDAYERLNDTNLIKPRRPCVTHCNFMSAESIARMKRLGIVADLQPAWLYLDGATLYKQFGDRRLEYFQPYKSLFEAGIPVGGGSDHMQKIGGFRSVNPYNPFLGMWIAIKRQPRRLAFPLRSEQRITRKQAPQLYTINNAYLTFEEQEKGSIEQGKLADLVVLDRDILTCPLDKLRDTVVRRTYLGGQLVYEKK